MQNPGNSVPRGFREVPFSSFCRDSFFFGGFLKNKAAEKLNTKKREGSWGFGIRFVSGVLNCASMMLP